MSLAHKTAKTGKLQARHPSMNRRARAALREHKDMAKDKREIMTDNGERAMAAFPVIVSASRSTDIPAFYADWFFDRLKKGYSVWTNPFNNKKYYVAYEDTRFIVFWSKNPKPLLNHLDYLKERKIGCYIQFTLNDYEKENLESGVPPLAERMETFRALAGRLGKGAVVWRFDPLILTDAISIDSLIERIRNIGSQLHDCAEKLVFSFLDIAPYKKVQKNLARTGIRFQDWTEEQMREFAARLVELNKNEGWNLELASCGEKIDLPDITHNKCVDDRLIVRLCRSPELWKFLGAEESRGKDLFGNPEETIDIGNGEYAVIKNSKKDKGQRGKCGCVESKDIGQYNTCPHLCEYCYANAGKDIALRNYELHKANPAGETITGS